MPPDNPHPLDTAQALAQKQANYVANTGYGYGLRYSVGLSEQLMLDFTKQLTRNGQTTLGQALAAAKQRYYLRNYQFSYYDEKTLIQSTLYGLPMYEVSLSQRTATDEAALLTEELPEGVIVEEIPIAFDEAFSKTQIRFQLPALTEETTDDGTYYSLGGLIHSEHGEPIQPRLPFEVSVPGTKAHGLVFKGGTYSDTSPFDPVIAEAFTLTQPSAVSSELPFTETNWYPAIPSQLNILDNGTEAQLTALLGQYNSTIDGGTERLYSELSVDVYYHADSDDWTEPTITSINSQLATGTATVTVITSDESGIHDVLVTHTDQHATWQSTSLTDNGDAWTGSFSATADTQFFVQVVDKAGNVTVDHNNGTYYTLRESAVGVTNVRDTTFTVSWLTNHSTSGEVRYGTDSNNLNQIADDERGAATNDDMHYVTISGLNPNTTYYFDLLSGNLTDDNGGQHYSVTTGATLSPPAVDTIHGQVFKSDGVTPAVGTIVYITLKDNNGAGSSDSAAPLSALVDDNGDWFANLGEVRLTELSSYFNYSASGDELLLEAHGAADGHDCGTTVDTANDSSAPDLILSHDSCTVTQTIDLPLGWSYVALPLEPIAALTAEQVCNQITEQGGSIVEIDRWHNSGWSGHICGLSFNNFDLELGTPYFINSNNASSWTIEGSPVSTALSFDLKIGWNPLSVPHSDGYSAESLCDEIINQGVTAVEIDRWHNSGWDGHICGLSFNDFDIERDQGYFLKASSNGTVTPSVLGLSGRQPPSETEPVPPAPVPANKTVAVRDLRLSNLRDNSVTLSWSTNEPATGYVLYGETTLPELVEGELVEGAELGDIAYDVRGASVAQKTHVVVLTNLAPQTSYYFKVVSGAEAGTRTKEQQSAPLSFTTAPTPEGIPHSDTVYGRVYMPDGVTPAASGVLYLTLQDADGTGSQGEAMHLSGLIDEKGYWHANLGNARTAQGGYFHYSPNDTVTLSAQGADESFTQSTLTSDQMRPAEPLTLQNKQSHQIYIPLLLSQQ